MCTGQWGRRDVLKNNLVLNKPPHYSLSFSLSLFSLRETLSLSLRLSLTKKKKIIIHPVAEIVQNGNQGSQCSKVK